MLMHLICMYDDVYFIIICKRSEANLYFNIRCYIDVFYMHSYFYYEDGIFYILYIMRGYCN